MDAENAQATRTANEKIENHKAFNVTNAAANCNSNAKNFQVLIWLSCLNEEIEIAIDVLSYYEHNESLELVFAYYESEVRLAEAVIFKQLSLDRELFKTLFWNSFLTISHHLFGDSKLIDLDKWSILYRSKYFQNKPYQYFQIPDAAANRRTETVKNASFRKFFTFRYCRDGSLKFQQTFCNDW